MSMSRRNFLKIALSSTLGTGAVGAGGAVYSTHVEPYNVETEEVTLSLSNLPRAFDGFTLVQVSDIHMGGWMTVKQMQVIADKVNVLNPDLIVLTGDFVLNILPPTRDDLRASLPLLKAPDGVIGILGNHDHWYSVRVVSRLVRDAGVHLLQNAHIALQRGTETLYIVGIDDVWEEKQDLDAGFNGVPESACTILLVHEPDYADVVAADGRANVQFSGHSHGGQVRLPLIGAPILPYLGRKYDAGLYTIQNLTLYVNRGVGMTHFNIRFNCPPEITKFTLRSA